MGCDCNTARDKVDDDDSSPTLARCVARVGTTQPYLAPPCRSSTATLSPRKSQELIRTMCDPLSTQFTVDSTLRTWDKAVVLQATHLGTGQLCFLKRVRKDKGAGLLMQKANFGIEAERLAKLDHPLVLRTYETMQDDSHFYLVTEPYLSGTLNDNLPNLLLRKESVAARIMYQILRALSYCHNIGVVHGCLSLHDVVVTDATVTELVKVKLTGFGEFDELCPVTERFKAPEAGMMRNEKCDVWSCGKLLSAMLDYQLPTPSIRSAINRRRSTMTYESSTRVEKSNEVVSLVALLLQENPLQRPTAAQCLAHPWFLAHIKQPFFKITTFNNCLYNLRKLRNRNPLQQAILKFIVTRIMREKDLEQYIQIFFALDKDLDGTIDEEELRLNFVKIMPDADALAVTKRVMEAADYNGSGVISFTEFLVSCLGEKKLLSLANLQTAFRCFDRKGIGAVPTQDIRNFFFIRGPAEKERQWRELLIQADRSGDNLIDFAEFTALLTDSEYA